ncbi:MAG: tryptophan 7-halogenase [Betaproteobacteria bacterium]|nr:tryptophan 7-halogenase [Betaproteobacteria bacterium]
MAVPKTCDVVVIGGGPAGSLAATYLSQAGYHAVLLEKQKHPRNVVGESLIPDFWKYCDEAGVSDKIAADGFIRKAGGIVDWHGATRRLAFKDFGYTRPALHVERDRFDHLLLEHAREQGVQVFEDVAAQGAELGVAPGARVACRAVGGEESAQIACRVVVDASGQNAVIGRQLGLRAMDEAFRFMSVWGYYTGSRYLAADGEMHPAESARNVPPTTYVTSVPGTGDWGWCWHILLRESTSVGLVLPIDAMKSVKDGQQSWENYLDRQCRALPRLGALLADAQLRPGSVRVIRDYSYRSTRLAGPGFFLIGDAAGFVDPIFSVGVVLAMYSARAAAWAIDRSFRAPGRAAEHQAIYTKQLQSRVELARALALPQYEVGSAATGEAKKAMQFADANARALIRAASQLTARSQHVQALMDDTPAPAGPEAD